MLRLLLRWLLSALALIGITYLVPGIHVSGFLTALVAALVIGIVNALVRPLLIRLTLPVTVVTLGLFLLVINAVLFGLAALLVPGFTVDGVAAALFGSVLYWLASLVINALIGYERKQARKRKTH
jgi:putative membrane protein